MITDPERNWKARMESFQAEQAMKDERHAKNARTAALWTGALFMVAGTLMLLWIGGLIK